MSYVTRRQILYGASDNAVASLHAIHVTDSLPAIVPDSAGAETRRPMIIDGWPTSRTHTPRNFGVDDCAAEPSGKGEASMKTALVLLGSLTALIGVGVAHADDEPIPAKVGMVKTAKLARFVAKSATAFPLPVGASEDPRTNGAEIRFFDTAGTGGAFVHALPAAGWRGIGKPAGSKGFKYRGKLAGDPTCKSVLINAKVIRAVCKGAAVTLSTPFAGDDGIILGISSGTASAALRYCAELGGTTKRNDARLLKRIDAPPPSTCPVFMPPPTATGTPAGTASATATPAGTSAATATATNTAIGGATATPTLGGATPTRTPTSGAGATATPTVTPSSSCAMAPGRYTFTTTGGTLRVSTFAPFAFPAGGTTIQDVGTPNVNCVHDTVVPYPGGLTVPVFCVPALGATTQVTQTGCGIGKVDSDGGSDFTISERGDTSETTVCHVHQSLCPASGPAPDSSGRIDVTVGDGTADTCASGGTGNAVLTIPVNTLTWVAADSSCPDTDGTYNPGTDTKLAEFPQTLDLTTDTNTAQFADIDSDGCAKSGLGPTGPFASTGQCVNFGNHTVNIAASGTVFSSGGPTYDLLFTTVQNNTMSGPSASGGATCGSPPVINLAGSATRCLVGP
jgi:hypothetical protein